MEVVIFYLQPSKWLCNLPHSVNQTCFWKVSWMFSTILNQICPNLFLLYDETLPSSNIVFWQGELSCKFASSDDCWKWTRSWVLSSVAVKKQQAGQLEGFFGGIEGSWRVLGGIEPCLFHLVTFVLKDPGLCLKQESGHRNILSDDGNFLPKSQGSLD